MIAPLTSGKCQLNGRGIASATTVAILMSIAPHEVSARAGPSHLLDAWRFRGQRQRPELPHAKSQRAKLWAWAAAGSDTETRLPIAVAALPILLIESAAHRGERRQAAGLAALDRHRFLRRGPR